jgi:hypothetical protein
MQRLRIGIVRCGEVTPIMHLPSLAHLGEHFAVTALCDVSNQVLRAVGEHWQVPKRRIVVALVLLIWRMRSVPVVHIVQAATWPCTCSR